MTVFASLGLALLPRAASAQPFVESQIADTELGGSMAGAGDLDGDGYDDLLVGATRYDAAGTTDAGGAVEFAGSAAGPDHVPDWLRPGTQVGERFGSVAGAGDVDGDGFDDVIVGAPYHSTALLWEGQASLSRGSANGPARGASWQSDGDGKDQQWFGWAVGGAGDVNGDGFDDVIVGSPGFQFGYWNEHIGMAYVYLGSPRGLRNRPVWQDSASNWDGYFGWSVASAGDVNGDGFADIVVGERGGLLLGGQAEEGVAYVYQGSPTGPSSAPSWNESSHQRQAHFGSSVASAGDVNGDGFDDVVVGAPDQDGANVDEGGAFLFLGDAAGLSTLLAWSVDGSGASAHFGASVASAGDVDADGFDDLLVGAPGLDSGSGAGEGAAYLFLGSANGPSFVPDWTGEGDSTNAQYGTSVAGAGDVDGDGYADYAIGAPTYSDGQADEGAVFLVHGGP